MTHLITFQSQSPYWIQQLDYKLVATLKLTTLVKINKAEYQSEDYKNQLL